MINVIPLISIRVIVVCIALLFHFSHMVIDLWFEKCISSLAFAYIVNRPFDICILLFMFITDRLKNIYSFIYCQCLNEANLK